MSRRVLLLLSLVVVVGVTLLTSINALAQTSTPTPPPTTTPTPTGTVTATATTEPYVYQPFSIVFDFNDGTFQNFQESINDRCSIQPPNYEGNNPSMVGDWLRCVPRSASGDAFVHYSYFYLDQLLVSQYPSYDSTADVFIGSVSFGTDWWVGTASKDRSIDFVYEYETHAYTTTLNSGMIGGSYEIFLDDTIPARTSAGGFDKTFIWHFRHNGNNDVSALGIDTVQIDGYFQKGIAPTATPNPTITPTATITATPTISATPTVVYEGDFPYTPIGGEDDAPLGITTPIDHGETCLTLGPVRVGTDEAGNDVEIGLELCLHQWEYQIGLLGYNFSTQMIAYASGFLILFAWLRTR